MKTQKIKLSAFVFDESLYPRLSVDDSHISDLVRALQAGVVLPPVVVEKGTNRIVDGRHRVGAYRRVLKDDSAIDAEVRTYPNEAALFMDAVACNASHGRKLARQDQAHIVLKLRDLGVKDTDISVALHVPQDVVQRLSVRIVHDDAGVVYPLKRGVEHMRGQTMTVGQLAAMKSVRSAEVGRLCMELSSLIANDMIDTSDENAMAKLRALSVTLSEYLHAVAA